MVLAQRRDAPWLVFGVTVGSVAGALLLTLNVEPYLQGTVLPPFLVAVVVSALWGGYRHGALASILSFVALKYFFVAKLHSLVVADVGGVARLGMFIALAVIVVWLGGRLKATHDQLLELASVDPLTELRSRRYLFEVLDRQVDLLRRTGGPISCLMLDIDRFKAINDTYGHDNGDKVLRAVAAVLRSRVRRIDTAARLGGEEFVVVLPATNRDGALVLAKSLQGCIAEEPNWPIPISVTVSIGVATIHCSEHSTENATELLGRADAALYAAKRAGRNCVKVDDSNDGQPGSPSAIPNDENKPLSARRLRSI